MRKNQGERFKEKSWRENPHRGRIREEESWRSNHAGGAMEEEPCGESMEESWKRNWRNHGVVREGKSFFIYIHIYIYIYLKNESH